MNSPLTLPSQKVTISPVGLRIDSELTFDEWKALAGSLGQAARSIGLCIDEDQAGRRLSTRRLRKSISLGRVATPKDLEPDPADKGIENHIPFVNRLVGWWRRMQDDRFLDKATKEQREALKRDLEPVVSIYDQL